MAAPSNRMPSTNCKGRKNWVYWLLSINLTALQGQPQQVQPKFQDLSFRNHSSNCLCVYYLVVGVNRAQLFPPYLRGELLARNGLAAYRCARKLVTSTFLRCPRPRVNKIVSEEKYNRMYFELQKWLLRIPCFGQVRGIKVKWGTWEKI